MAFNRIVEMTASKGSFTVHIDNLDIEFTIERSREFSKNIAKFKIYNPSIHTTNNFFKTNTTVIFKAGYEDEGTGVIYVGKIINVAHNTFPPNPFIELECNSFTGKNTDTFTTESLVSLTYGVDTYIVQPLDEIAAILNLTISGKQHLEGIKLSNGFVYTGLIRQGLWHIQLILEAYGIGLFIDNTTLILYARGAGYLKKAVILSNKTGLLETPKLTANQKTDAEVKEDLTQRTTFKSILNYKVVPNALIKIESTGISGTFVVEKCIFAGNNFGGEYTVSGEAITVQES